MIEGLYQLISAKLLEATGLRAKAANADTSAPKSYRAKEEAKQLDRQVEQHRAHVEANEDDIVWINAARLRLQKKGIASAYRTLANQKMEEAMDHLRRELGDKSN